MPECHLCMYDEIIAFDHLANKAVIIQNIHKGDNIKQKYEELEDKAELILHKMERPVSLSKDRFTPVKTEVTSNLTKEQYEANVKKAKEYIKDGDIFQLVLPTYHLLLLSFLLEPFLRSVWLLQFHLRH